MQEQNFLVFYNMLTNGSIYPNAFASITFKMADYFKLQSYQLPFPNG